MGRAKTALGPCFTPFCQPYAREGQAVVCPLLRGSSPTRWVAPKQHWGPALLLFVSLTRARARPWSARCYGVARQRDGSRQNSIGVSGVLSLRHFGLVLFIHFGAWVPKNLARRVLIYWFRRRDAARPDRAAWAVQRRLAARWRGRRPDRNSGLRGPALLLFVSLTRARARPWSARCYGVARQRDGSRQNSFGVSGVLSLRHFGLVLFIHF